MIPKVIHYCWFGNGQLPEQDKKNIETWKKFCPDYEIIEWNEKNYNISSCKYMEDAYTCKKWGFVPDFARFDIVYQYGGFYFDTDVEMVKPLDELLNNDAFMGFEGGNLINGGHGFGAEAKNAVIKDLRDMYFDLKFINDDGTMNLVASPQYITERLKMHGLIANNKQQCVDGMTIFPNDYFCPMDYETGKLKKTPNTFSIHWFNASWVDEKNKKRSQVERKIKRILGKKIGNFVTIIFWKFCRFSDLIRQGGLKAVFNKVKKKIGKE